ncbi:MAG TPA: substrate-binding domain-containing protein [Anaerolineaceae bacterium]
MRSKNRLATIEATIAEHGFISVSELSKLYAVTEMTIRRDLIKLEQKGSIRRTFGGAVSLRTLTPQTEEPPDEDDLNVEQVDALVTALTSSQLRGTLPDSVIKKNIPIIAESLPQEDTATCVSVDNYQAGVSVGRWAGQYAIHNFGGKAYILDLTYHLPNTQARSRGFMDGIREIIPNAEVVLSINTQSRQDITYRLTRDALTVHPKINLIFAINDSTAWGAVNACRDQGIAPGSLIVIPFGMEGERLKDALVEGKYVKGGLAMFPEIVGPACVEAAIQAYNRNPLPTNLVTPYAIVTLANLAEFYLQRQGVWELLKETYTRRLYVPINIDPDQPRPAGVQMPRRIGLVIPFREHEWYQKLIASMQAYANRIGIDLGVVDAEQSIKYEIDLCRKEIARAAAQQIEPGDSVLIDSGPISDYLAEELLKARNCTIITNSASVFNILRQNPNINLVSTGGVLRFSSQVLVGPTAESTLRELRVDKLFLSVTGISLNFGLSHTNISEVTIKQTMIQSARQVILLADHTCFGQESVIQVAPASVIHRVITDDALAASPRLELGKLGIDVILAEMS